MVRRAPPALAQPGPTRLLLRALLRRCPRCGGGRLFTSWLRMVDRCPRCGMPFQREEAYFLGAFVVNFGAVLILLGAYIAIAVAITLPRPPATKLALVGAAVAIAFPIAFYPFSRTIWAAIDLCMRPLEADEVAAAD